jgi:hypothetical protein
VLGEAGPEGVDDVLAVGHEGDAVAGELGVPGRERAAAGAAGADRGDEGVALRERGRVGPAGGRAGGAQRRDDLGRGAAPAPP